MSPWCIQRLWVSVERPCQSTMVKENFPDALSPGAQSKTCAAEAGAAVGEPWNVSNLLTSCPSFWKRLTQRSRLSHPSLASQQLIPEQRSLDSLQEGPLWCVPGPPSWKLRFVATASKAPILGRKKEDRMGGTSVPHH